MNSDGEHIRESSLYARRWMNRHPSVQGQSITDWLLYDMSERTERMYCGTLDKDEAVRETGADWEWWFVFDYYALKLRVHAKKMDHGGDNYGSVAYANRLGLPTETFLAQSITENFVPLYAFYIAHTNDTMCSKRKTDEGVYLAGARTLYDRFAADVEQPVSDTDILRVTVPLSCLICCPLCTDQNDGFVDFLHAYFTKDAERRVEDDEGLARDDRLNVRGMHRQLPEHVSSFLKHAQDGVPQSWAEEFSGHVEHVNALVVYDARNR